MAPPEVGTSYPIAPHTVEIRWVWYYPGAPSKVTFQTGGTSYKFFGQADEPPANTWIQVIETATNANGVTVTESLPSWWGGYSGSAAPSGFIPGSGYLYFESSATSENYTVTVSFGAQLPSGALFPSGVSNSYTNTGVNPSNVRIKLCAVNYAGVLTETVVGNDVPNTYSLNRSLVAFYAVAYDSTNPSVYVRLPVVGVPPLAWYISRGMNTNLIANAAAKKAAYVPGTGAITSYMSNGNLNPTPGIFCATGELNALRAYYRTPPTLNIPVTGCPSGQIPFGAYRGFLSSGKSANDVYTLLPGRASCQYTNISDYYREVPAFNEYLWAFANPPSKIQTALAWQWGFYTPETPDDVGIRGDVETYIGPDKLGVSPEPQWITNASIKFNPAWTWSAGFQTASSDIGPWSPVNGFLTAGTYVRWSLYNQPPSNYLDSRTGTPLNSGGEWWVTDADGTNPVRVATSLVGWQQTLRVQDTWLGKNLYFKQVATPAGECTETAVSLEPVYVVGYISASKLIPRPVPPLA
jgi:hypothetical protein